MKSAPSENPKTVFQHLIQPRKLPTWLQYSFDIHAKASHPTEMVSLTWRKLHP